MCPAVVSWMFSNPGGNMRVSLSISSVNVKGIGILHVLCIIHCPSFPWGSSEKYILGNKSWPFNTFILYLKKISYNLV